MSPIVFNGQTVELNEEGFLVDPALWNDELALVLAKAEEGLDQLTDEHWSVIRFIRGHYLEHRERPHGAVHVQGHRACP